MLNRGWSWGATRCVTPRQTCPRPDGFGRNLRSKTRWFTGFCNSHQVSHFATFFIDARAEISVAESRILLSKTPTPPARSAKTEHGRPAISFLVFLGAFRAGGSLIARGKPSPEEGDTPRTRVMNNKRVLWSFCCAGFDNDPSAGSPTETLLRLLLPLNDKVQWTSRDVAASEPPTSPRSEHFTGSFNR